ncbi:hypothetical protein BV22DRAFT_364107 [Leucogyrophana mollusca]|uniref:Uncharacterized protein n=1 Tax=Leucogyrophana mollusca TaxID=85980 RepID=A0ACB8BMF6_9AGAM|nr:hypothetical protein BV22DRAFT_364107 [Leucogyrophana mollusca]
MSNLAEITLVKIPKHLMARWATIDAEDVHLATIRVYNKSTSANGKSPRIFLFLPPDPNNPTPRGPDLPTFLPNAAHIPADEGGVVDRYELDMVNEDVDNQIVIAERPKDPASLPSSSRGPRPAHNSRARTTILTGRIKHECNLRPLFTESYRKQMRERSRAYNTPKRQIRMIEEAGVSGGRGGINRLSSGVNSGSFAGLIHSKPKPAKGAFERMARMPRNQLLDLLFTLFREQPRWSIKPLRERTQQPEVYLKEVLGEIATLNRSGEHNGTWELTDIFRQDGVKGEGVPGPSSLTGSTTGDVAMAGIDGEDDDEDDDDEDDDMEEVS